MSKENAKRFFELIDENQELKSKYVEVVGKYLGQTLSEAEMDKIYLEILPLAREAGLEFTLAELKELQAPQEGKLSDEELDKVVAGGDGMYEIRIYCPKVDNSTLDNVLLQNKRCPQYEYRGVSCVSYECGTCKNFGPLIIPCKVRDL